MIIRFSVSDIDPKVDMASTLIISNEMVHSANFYNNFANWRAFLKDCSQIIVEKGKIGSVLNNDRMPISSVL